MEIEMKIVVHANKLASKEKLTKQVVDETKRTVEERLERTLKRFESEIEMVEIHLEDETLASQKFDGLAKAQVHRRFGDMISVTCRGDSVAELIANATTTLQHAMERKLDKKRN
jgi:hypothetical protein